MKMRMTKEVLDEEDDDDLLLEKVPSRCLDKATLPKGNQYTRWPEEWD